MLRDNRGPFYGWFVVAAAFAVTFVGFGCPYSFSAFIEPLQRDFGASRGSVSLVFALAGFLYFSVGSISGPLADRFGSRRLAFIGMIMIGTGLVAASVAQSLLQVYSAYGLGIGLGVGCSYVPAVGAVPRWFARRRGLAFGIASSGIGFGTLIVPPLASLLITDVGWRETYLILGVLAVIAGAGMALLIENDPRVRGLGPTAIRRNLLLLYCVCRAPRSRKRSARGNSSASTRRAFSAPSAFSFRSCTLSPTRPITASRPLPLRCW